MDRREEFFGKKKSAGNRWRISKETSAGRTSEKRMRSMRPQTT